MKVTLTCEKCGHTWEPDESWSVAFCDPDRGPEIRAKEEPCPNCAKLTYGPLTEEMVADALIECSRSHNEVEDDYYEVEARFVLRTMNALRPVLGLNKPDTRDEGQWRDWLLDLAWQK